MYLAGGHSHALMTLSYSTSPVSLAVPTHGHSLSFRSLKSLHCAYPPPP